MDKNRRSPIRGPHSESILGLACTYLHVDSIRATVGRSLHHLDSILDLLAGRYYGIGENLRGGVQTSFTSTLGKTHYLWNPVKMTRNKSPFCQVKILLYYTL